jgi:hypothetical protein
MASTSKVHALRCLLTGIALLPLTACEEASEAPQPGAEVDGGAAPGDGDLDPATSDASAHDGSALTADASDPDACVETCAPSCSDDCATEGTTRCEDDGTLTCVRGADGCLAWGTRQACEGGQTCVNDACGPCTSGTTRCSASADVQACDETAGGYVLASDCDHGCSEGLCLGACTPHTRRCHGAVVEQCKADGEGWTELETCTHRCDGALAACEQSDLDVQSDTSLEGEVLVSGTFRVRAGVTVTVPSGNLSVRASSIVVEAGGRIVVSPVDGGSAGAGSNGTNAGCGGAGGGHANMGGEAGVSGAFCGQSVGGYFVGSSMDASVQGGGKGGKGGSQGTGSGGAGGFGGGRLTLLAGSIAIAGTLQADGQAGGSAVLGNAPYSGGGGGGAGGGILLAADRLSVTGTLSVAGGTGGSGVDASAGPIPDGATGGEGSVGRIKLLYGSSLENTGTLVGTKRIAIAPPLQLSSSTFPDPKRTYNDDVPAVVVSWSRPFPAVQGYLYRVDTTNGTVPTLADDLTQSEQVSLDPSWLASGLNQFHVTSKYADAASPVASQLALRINRSAPSVSSTTHPSEQGWYGDDDPLFSWTYPAADSNFVGVRYVVDHYGDSVPSATDMLTDGSNSGYPLIGNGKHLWLQNVSPGAWALHAVTIDQQGRPTKAVAHTRFNIGPNPGSGLLQGKVTHQGAPLAGAKVRLNRGLVGPDQVTQADGSYSFPSVPAGQWEVEASASGYATSTTSGVMVTSGLEKQLDLSL